MATKRYHAGSSGWAASPAGAEDITRELWLPQNQQTDSGFPQQLCPKQRLRWTTELHKQFVKAVADLGGETKATPKSISELMGVEGITLFQIKSHLQKFRLGKTGQKLRREEFIPLKYRKNDGILPLVNKRAQGSSSPSTFTINGSNTAGAKAYGNLHLLGENPQAAVEKFDALKKILGQITNEAATTSGSEPAEAAKPALLSLFSTCEWLEYLHAKGQNKYLDSDNAHYHP